MCKTCEQLNKRLKAIELRMDEVLAAIRASNPQTWRPDEDSDEESEGGEKE
jgi:hypothetical protein